MNEFNNRKLELIITNPRKTADPGTGLPPGKNTGTDDWSTYDPNHQEETNAAPQLNLPFTQRKHLRIATQADSYRESDNRKILSLLFRQADEWYINNNPFRYCCKGWYKTPLNHRAILQINLPKNHQIEYSLITETLSISNPGKVLNSELFLTRPLPFTPPIFHDIDSSLGEAAEHVAHQIREGTNIYLYFKKKHITFEGQGGLSLREIGSIRLLDEKIFNMLRDEFMESSGCSPKICLAYSRE